MKQEGKLNKIIRALEQQDSSNNCLHLDTDAIILVEIAFDVYLYFSLSV